MEQNQLEQQLRESQLQTWQKLMYVALGSAATILFHVRDPLRDIILMLTLLYTTLSGFYLVSTLSSQNPQLGGSRRKVAFGHLFASWLTVFGIYSYSQLPALGLVFLAYTVILLIIYWQTGKRLATSVEMFP